MNANSSTQVADFILKRGIHDRPSGLKQATGSREFILAAGRHGVPKLAILYQETFVLMGFLTRAQSFHQSTVQALESDNHFSAFTLLRALAENAAVLAYLLENPTYLERYFIGAKVHTYVPIGKVLGGAAKRLPNIKPIHDELSKFAHPTSGGVVSAMRATGEDRTMEWTSFPKFKEDGDYLMACCWTVELAEANAHLWLEAVDAFQPMPHNVSTTR